MCYSRVKQYLEPVGLVLLLFAFGWQCFEDRANQIKNDGYIYELDKKLQNIWAVEYEEAVNSDRYRGTGAFCANVDSLHTQMKDWSEIQKTFKQVNRQTEFSFNCRALLYLLGSIFVILSKWPASNNHETLRPS